MRDVTRVVVVADGAGDHTLVAARSGKSVRVLSGVLIISAAGSVRFESGAGGTALSGVMSLAANGQLILPEVPSAWLETAKDALLNLEITGAANVRGFLNVELVQRS